MRFSLKKSIAFVTSFLFISYKLPLHETDVQTRRDIIEATWQIRKKIQELRPSALKMVADRFFEEHPAFTRDLLPEFGANEAHAAGSYF